MVPHIRPSWEPILQVVSWKPGNKESHCWSFLSQRQDNEVGLRMNFSWLFDEARQMEIFIQKMLVLRDFKTSWIGKFERDFDYLDAG